MKLRLTDRSLRSLVAPEGKYVEFWDTSFSAPGASFGVRVSGTTNARSWSLMYRKDGRERRLTLGAYPSMTLADARKKAYKIAADVLANDADPVAERRARQEAPTFGDVAALFRKRHASLRSAATAREYGRVLDREALPRWGELKIADVKRRDVIALLDEIAHDRKAPIQANRTRAILHALFQWALGRELVESNPVAGVSRPAPERRRDRVLTDPEIKKLWDVLDSEAEPLRSLLRFLLLTGQRVGETRSSRWADVDFEGAVWSIPGPTRKGGRPHRVPLSPEAVAILEGLRHLTGSGHFVFASPSPRGKGQPITWISHAASRLRKACGFEFRVHDLRRTLASGLARLGTDRDTISKVLGHRSADAGVIGIYDRYGRENERRAALDGWGRHIATIIEAKSSKTEAA